jgi:hypothetical protein
MAVRALTYGPPEEFRIKHGPYLGSVTKSVDAVTPR